jgi:hypothetical protein
MAGWVNGRSATPTQTILESFLLVCTICFLLKNTPLYTGMDLDLELGPWLPVCRYSWLMAYKTVDSVLWGQEDSLLLNVIQKMSQPGFIH